MKKGATSRARPRHWVEPKLVAEITYLTWTADNLLRHAVYVGLREDKRARDVRREAAVAR
jgi:bifunctional non-homologous end joining protein LigD